MLGGEIPVELLWGTPQAKQPFVRCPIAKTIICEGIMKHEIISTIKTAPSILNPLDAQTTYHISGRSFVVQPVFKPENNNTLGDVLLRLMQADCEKSL